MKDPRFEVLKCNILYDFDQMKDKHIKDVYTGFSNTAGLDDYQTKLSNTQLIITFMDGTAINIEIARGWESCDDSLTVRDIEKEIGVWCGLYDKEKFEQEKKEYQAHLEQIEEEKNNQKREKDLEIILKDKKLLEQIKKHIK